MLNQQLRNKGIWVGWHELGLLSKVNVVQNGFFSISACFVATPGSMPASLSEREVSPRSFPLAGRWGACTGHRSGSERVQLPGHACPPLALDHLFLRPAPVALRGVDNMLHRRPRDPELFRDRRGSETGFEGGEDQPFLSRGH